MIRTLIYFICFFATNSYADNSIVLLGVVEESIRAPNSPAVRVLFMKNNNKWNILNTSKSHEVINMREIDWILAFDGRNIGKLKTIDDYEINNPDCDWCFPRDKYFRLVSKSDFPQLGNKDERFSDWGGFLPKNRPIVLVNKPYFLDHENWKQYKPDFETLKILFPELKKRIGEAYHCHGAPKWNATKISVTINDVVLYRSYKNNKGQKIISAGLYDIYTKECDGPLDKTDKPIWFFVDNVVKFIGYELDLLDAADYDNDGKVEFIFSHSGYNRDGYTLYESEFNERYDYYWGYH